MRHIGAGLGALVLALTPAAGAIWPDQIPPFHRASTSTPTLAGDAAVWEEYGFDEAERAVFESGGTKYTTSAWRFRDATSAMAAYQYIVPADAPAADIVSMGAKVKDGLLMVFGNYVLQWEQRMPTEAELRFVFERLPRLDQGPRPTFVDLLPRRGRVPNADRYILGPASLTRFEPRITPSVAGFHFGAEAQLARYRIDGKELALVVFNYPTPQISRDRQTEFQKLPGTLVKRAGPLVAVVLPPADPDAAEKLLANVRYQANITWTESTSSKTELQRFADFILNVFIFIGILILFSALSGLGVIGLRRLVTKPAGKGTAGDPMILLHLRDK